MKVKPITVIVIGILLLVGGSLLSISAYFKSIFDPSQEAVETIDYYDDNPYFDYEEDDIENESYRYWDSEKYSYNYEITIHLDKGEYELWYEYGFLGYNTPGDVIIEDLDGNEIFEDSPSNKDDNVAVNFQEYRKLGTFEIPRDGYYNFSSEEESTFHITEPFDRTFLKALSAVGGIVAVIGVIILIFGFVYLFNSEKEKKKED